MKNLRFAICGLVLALVAITSPSVDAQLIPGRLGGIVSTPWLAPNGTAAAPAYSFSAEPGLGFYRAATGVIGVGNGNVSGVNPFAFNPTQLVLGSAISLGWGSTTNAVGSAADVVLSRGAANLLSLASGDSFAVGAGAALQMGSVPIIAATAPTVTSAGTSPSVSGGNSASFRINVGTGGTATTIVLAMPIAAATGWNCSANNITAAAANRANLHMVQQSSTTAAVTVQWQTVSTGAATAFLASDIVSFVCIAF